MRMYKFIDPHWFVIFSVAVASSAIALAPAVKNWHFNLLYLISAALLLRPYLRLGLEALYYNLHHKDYGSVAEEAGSGSEAIQEKVDVEAQFYGSWILVLTLSIELFL